MNEQDLPFFIGLMEHLARKGLNCPQPVHDRKGSALGRLAGRPAAIVTFLDGMGVRRPGVNHCGAVGEALAQLHLAGSDFRYAGSTHYPCRGGALFEQPRDRADKVTPGLADATQRAGASNADWPATCPGGHPRRSLPRQRVLPRPRLSGLIDFYFACTDALAYDLAVCLNAWCFEPDGVLQPHQGPGDDRRLRARAAAVGGRGAALPILARGAALRFMLTRLVDWLNVPPGALVKPKDPLEYYRKLRFHERAAAAIRPRAAVTLHDEP